MSMSCEIGDCLVYLQVIRVAHMEHRSTNNLSQLKIYWRGENKSKIENELY